MLAEPIALIVWSGRGVPDEDDIGLKGKTCTKHYIITNWGHVNALIAHLMFILGYISGPTVVSKKSRKRKSQREAGDDDFEDKENKG